MSVVNEMANPMNPAQPFQFAKGSIKFISIKPVKPGPNVVDGVKTTYIKQAGKPDKKIESTHSISFLLQEVDDANNVIDASSQGEWISMGEKKLHPSHTDKVQIKVGDNWKDVLPGMVVTVPLKISKSGDRTFINASLAKLNILDESRASQQSQPATKPSAQSGQTGGATTKVFGEITDIQGGVATVVGQDGTRTVNLSEDQVAQIQVGGRLAAQIYADGNVASGFKAYGPAGSGGGFTGGKKGNSNYDPIGVACGHAINGLKELKGAGYKVADEMETLKIIHRATMDMKAFVAERTGKDVDSNAVGASAGNAILVACSRFNAGSEVTEVTILESAKDVYTTLSEPFYEFLTNQGKVPDTTPAQVSKPEETAVVDHSGSQPPANFDDPVMDWDDEIPF